MYIYVHVYEKVSCFLISICDLAIELGTSSLSQNREWQHPGKNTKGFRPNDFGACAPNIDASSKRKGSFGRAPARAKTALIVALFVEQIYLSYFLDHLTKQGCKKHEMSIIPLFFFLFFFLPNLIRLPYPPQGTYSFIPSPTARHLLFLPIVRIRGNKMTLPGSLGAC
jgi:hypothetical protein